MVDSFITYDANDLNLESPSYLSNLRDEMFQHQVNFQAQNGLFRHNPNYHPNMIEMMPRDNHFEHFSHTSVFSNPSTKDSPEHTPDADYPLAEDENNQLSKVPPIIRKGIRKYYEPIIDNNTIYNYEDDPSEYRKARKRIQNRESATRVRNRKKTHVEILEDDVTILKRTNIELKQQNAALISENRMLKHQIRELEKTAPMKNLDGMMDLPDCLSHSTGLDNGPSMLHINKLDDDIDHNPVVVDKYYRSAPNSKFKKHMTMLGVFTLLLCVYGLLPRTESGTVQLFTYRGNLFGSANTALEKDSTFDDDSKFLNTQKNNSPTRADSEGDGDSSTRDSDDQSNQQDKDDMNDQFNEDPADDQFNGDSADSERGQQGPQFSEPHNNEWDRQRRGENGEQNGRPGPIDGRKFERPREKNFPHGSGPQDKESKFERDPVEIGHGPGPGPRSGHGGPGGPGGRFRNNKKRPPRKFFGHNMNMKDYNERFNKQSSSSNGTSLFTMMEVVMVACYSLYLLYVGFTAYKLHIFKRRDSPSAVGSTI